MLRTDKDTHRVCTRQMLLLRMNKATNRVWTRQMQLRTDRVTNKVCTREYYRDEQKEQGEIVVLFCSSRHSYGCVKSLRDIEDI